MSRNVLVLVLLSLVWALLTQLNLPAVLIAIPFVALAVAAFHKLKPQVYARIHWQLLPEFFLWFMVQSALGGIDVARRTLRPRMVLQPGYLEYAIRLPAGTARTFFINCVSLLPGTLSVSGVGSSLVLHALDIDAGVIGQTELTEQRVARLFGIGLAGEIDGP